MKFTKEEEIEVLNNSLEFHRKRVSEYEYCINSIAVPKDYDKEQDKINLKHHLINIKCIEQQLDTLKGKEREVKKVILIGHREDDGFNDEYEDIIEITTLTANESDMWINDEDKTFIITSIKVVENE